MTPNPSATARETAIEVMAEAFDKVAVIHDVYGENRYVENTEVACAAALDALLSALPAMGLRVVPVEATDVMHVAGLMHGGTGAGLAWSDMIAAAPHVLGVADGE